VPFPKNLDFVGRTDDLETLHTTLQQREPVGIRPAGLTGMGGIGKTQLAVEYVYRFRDAYPDGIFWINAAEPLAKGLALIGSRLRPEVLERPPDEQLRAAFDELKRRPGALPVFDNLEDPAQLARPVGAEASPLALGCRILFTTRSVSWASFSASRFWCSLRNPRCNCSFATPCGIPSGTIQTTRSVPRPERSAGCSAISRSPSSSPAPSSPSGLRSP
jgi:NB-ARC domain